MVNHEVAASTTDTCSFANVKEAVCESLHLDLHVDFDSRQLFGKVDLKMKVLHKSPVQ